MPYSQCGSSNGSASRVRASRSRRSSSTVLSTWTLKGSMFSAMNGDYAPKSGYVGSMADLVSLRPIERRITRLAEDGVVPDEIGRRFNRSGDYVERVLEFANLPGRRG